MDGVTRREQSESHETLNHQAPQNPLNLFMGMFSHSEFKALTEASKRWTEIRFDAGHKKWIEAGEKTYYAYIYTERPVLAKIVKNLCRQKRGEKRVEHKGIPLNKEIAVSGQIMEIRELNGSLLMLVTLTNGVSCIGPMTEALLEAAEGDNIEFKAKFQIAKEDINTDSYHPVFDKKPDALHPELTFSHLSKAKNLEAIQPSFNQGKNKP